MSVTALVGGQFGSEGKGAVIAHIAPDYDIHVRVGAANAGHTLYTQDWEPDGPEQNGRFQEGGPVWEKHVMQQLPCAAYANPQATLCIGPGAQISPEILCAELDRLHKWRRERRLGWPAPIYVDPRAHVITEAQIALEAASGLAERIGSTSTIAREGIGAAQAERVMRSDLCVTAGTFFQDGLDEAWGVILTDVPMYLVRADAAGHRILLEGTQGTGLSLTTGFFPYTTSRNTTAAGLAADCGVAPNLIGEVIGVFRTYPIRVAGPSGPFYEDSVEVSWADLGVDPENERTTVTKKVRRVATWSDRQLWEAVRLNGITKIALTFVDYLDGDEGGEAATDFCDRIQRVSGMYPRWIGYGPHHVVEAAEPLERAA